MMNQQRETDGRLVRKTGGLSVVSAVHNEALNVL